MRPQVGGRGTPSLVSVCSGLGALAPAIAARLFPAFTALRRRSSGDRADVVVADKDVAAAGVVRGADQAVPLHALDEIGGTIVADREAPLDVAGRRLAITQHDSDSAIVEALGAVVAAVAGTCRICVVDLADTVDVTRGALCPEMGCDGFDLVVGHEGTVHAEKLAGAGTQKHVALPEELFGALVGDDRAAVDLGRDAEADARREVGLD